MDTGVLCARRLHKELKEMTTSPPPLCSARLVYGNLFHWEATIRGPADSVYEGGVFRLSLQFKKTYPIDPPAVKFLTKIYHCNISQQGTICLDILSCNWIPSYTVSSILLSICTLLTDCNPSSPLEGGIARLFKTDRRLHDKKAREFTEKYATNQSSCNIM